MLTGTFRGVALGCGTDVWRLVEEVRAGELSQEQFLKSESSMIRSKGHCNTMGTASTMAVVAEALGTTSRAWPAPPLRTAGCSRPRTRPAGSPSNSSGRTGGPATS